MKLNPERVRARLDAVDKSAREVSIAVGGTPDLVRHILAGRQLNTSGVKLLRLASELESSVDYLYDRSEDVGVPPSVDGLDILQPQTRRKPSVAQPERLPLVHGRTLLPVRHIVQAGAWLEVDEGALHRVESPPVTANPQFPERAQWLELVRGDSVDLYYPAGTYVHVVDAAEIGYAPRHEDFVVVERRRQQGGMIERSLKQVEKKGRKIELWPRSRNPTWTAPLNLTDAVDGETVVEIAALVLGGYLPARR